MKTKRTISKKQCSYTQKKVGLITLIRLMRRQRPKESRGILPHYSPNRSMHVIMNVVL
jgi:hypothetical protein